MGGVASVTADAKGKGNDCFKKGEYLEAVEAYTRALDCDQRDHSLYSNRCAARLKLNQNGFALKDAIVCVTLAPSWGKGYYRCVCICICICLSLSSSGIIHPPSAPIRKIAYARLLETRT